MKEPWCHIIIVKIIIYNRHNIHLRTKQVVGLLGSSHNNWDHFACSDHIEELLGYVVRAVVVLKGQVEPGGIINIKSGFEAAEVLLMKTCTGRLKVVHHLNNPHSAPQCQLQRIRPVF